MLDKKQIPNILSIIRLLLIPLFVYIYFSGEDRVISLIIAAVIYSVAGLTDIIDGYLARKYNWITNLGKILDPLADKLMQAAAIICLVIDKLLPVWVCVIFFLKELFMLIGGLIILNKRRTMVVSNWYGKFATAVFYAIVMILIICSAFCPNMPSWVHTLLGFVLAGVIVFAIIMYYLRTFKGKFGLQVKKSISE